VDQELHLRVDLVLAVPDERQRLVHLLRHRTAAWRRRGEVGARGGARPL
jgi:hypothetical protein